MAVSSEIVIKSEGLVTVRRFQDEKTISMFDLMNILTRENSLVTPILPSGTKGIACKGNSFLIVIEEQPGLKTISFRYFSDESRTRRLINLLLYFPWTYHFILGSLSPIVIRTMSTSFSRKRVMWEDDKIGHMTVPNLNPPDSSGSATWCYGNIDLGEPARQSFTLNEAITKLIASIWGSEFNQDIFPTTLRLDAIVSEFRKTKEIQDDLENATGSNKEFLTALTTTKSDILKYLYWWRKKSSLSPSERDKVFALKYEKPYKEVLQSFLTDGDDDGGF